MSAATDKPTPDTTLTPQQIAWRRWWIAELREGDREQARKYLRTPQGYCCLGVLCELADGPDCWKAAPEDPTALDHFALRADGFSDVLPPRIRALVGLSAAEQNALVSKNDGRYAQHAHSFAEIADYLESITP